MAKEVMFNLGEMIEMAEKSGGEDVSFVKDHGIYILFQNEGNNKPDVLYGKGFDPNKDNWWDKATSLFGGEDFSAKINTRQGLKDLKARIIERGLDYRTAKFFVRPFKRGLKTGIEF